MTKELAPMPIMGVEEKPQFSLNGDSVILGLIGPSGLRIPLIFPREHLAFYVSRLMRVHLMAESIASQQGGAAEMPATDAAHVSAQSPYGAPLVALTVVTHLPAIQHFELTPMQADTLASELQSAANQARENAATSRN